MRLGMGMGAMMMELIMVRTIKIVRVMTMSPCSWSRFQSRASTEQ